MKSLHPQKLCGENQMRSLFALAVIAIMVSASQVAFAKGGTSGGSHSVRGHTTKNGTYVPPHRATNPNGTKSDNWSTKGNTNPYTGKQGTKNP
jgi:hypothetical protein